jgi:hypothetical protein
MAGSTLQISKPMSVKEISAKAEDFEFNPFIAMKYWLRTADTLLREVSGSRALLLQDLLTIYIGTNLRARRQ